MELGELVHWLDYGQDAVINGFADNRLSLSDKKLEDFFQESYRIKRESRGDAVYFRGLIELSNVCRKNCMYCGIRRDNKNVNRYELDKTTVLEEAEYALNAGYGSVVLQGGERTDSNFIERVCELVYEINKMGLGITLSLGEQTKETYKEWARLGAIRYLLRIESSNKDLYSKIHPSDQLHTFESRVEALENLKSCGYYTGTGVMIGLPFQTSEDLAKDLLFFKELDVEMVGMGPYIKHPDTPLAKEENPVSPVQKLLLSLKMIALLRRLMPWINIASTTALQVLDQCGREYGLLSGANVIMPNLTDTKQRGNYQLYSGKPGLKDDAVSTNLQLISNLEKINIPVGWNQMGNPMRKKDFYG